MEFLKKLFNDDDYVIGLSGFKDDCEEFNISHKKAPNYNIFTPPKNLVFYTNTKDNFLLK